MPATRRSLSVRIALAILLLASLAACASSTHKPRREHIAGSVGRAPSPMAPVEYNRVRTEPLITPDNDPFAAN